MNSLFIVLLAIGLLGCGYFFYSKKIANLWDVDPKNPTPAQTYYDGRDYVPAKNWVVLFGHHFASIAGAGPILGPVLACLAWGWLPALLWIVIGSIFIGGVHDLSSLMISLRYKGRSIGDISEYVVNKRTKIIFSSFLWLSLVLIIAVFALTGAQTLVNQPEVVIPTFGLIFDAILVGLMLYRWKVNQVITTIIGILILGGLIVLGYFYPISLPFSVAIILLFIYSFFASIIPVNILLQPRDYLSTFILFFGLLFGIIGIIITHPPINAPAYIGHTSAQGPLWPMLFVVIACGAISGFHGLISSGTTAKQLSSEKDARKIGYGAMILEGVLAIVALIAVSAGLGWTAQSGLPVFSQIMEEKGWILAFATGYGELLKPLFGSLGILVGATMINAFIITTLDSATRIGRYIGSELFGEGFKIKPLKNPWGSTFIIVALAYAFSFGPANTIWPVFGAANQLIGTLTLFIVSLFLLSKNKPVKYTLYPGIFMLFTTIFSLIYQGINFFSTKNYLLFSVSIILIILAGFVCEEGIKTTRKHILK